MHESAEVILAIPLWVQGRRSTQRDALAYSLNARPQSIGTRSGNLCLKQNVFRGKPVPNAAMRMAPSVRAEHFAMESNTHIHTRRVM
jgi:hypothetical protein